MKTFHQKIGTVLLAAGTCLYLGTAFADDSMRYGTSRSERQQRTGGTAEQGRQQGNLTTAEQKFIRETAAANLAEVKLARLALERSTSDDVKNFAQRVIDQHSNVNSKLVAIASDKGIHLPTVASVERPEATGRTDESMRQSDQSTTGGYGDSGNVDRRQDHGMTGAAGASDRSGSWNLQREMKPYDRDYDRLSRLSGAEFDKAYLQTEINDHKKTIQSFEQNMGDLRDPDLKNFASETLPALRDHLRMAQDLADRRS